MSKISIIVPVYKVEQYLPECVESLLAQTHKELEVILVDDGSPDNCGKLCDEYAAKDNRVKVIHKKNGGVSAARNSGLEFATGEWVIFCDSDDWMEETACKKLVDYGEKNNLDVVIGDVRIVEDNNTRQGNLFSKEFCAKSKEDKDDLIKTVLCKFYSPYITEFGIREGLFGGPWNKAVRRKLLIDKNIRFDLRVNGLYDDLLYTAYIYANAAKIGYTQNMVYNYRYVPGSVTHRYNPKIVETNNRIFESWMEFFDKFEKNGEYRNAYMQVVLRRLKGTINTYYFNEKNEDKKSVQLKKLGEMLETSPYKEAIKQTDTSNMPFAYKMFVYVMRYSGKLAPRILYLMRGHI